MKAQTATNIIDRESACENYSESASTETQIHCLFVIAPQWVSVYNLHADLLPSASEIDLRWKHVTPMTHAREMRPKSTQFSGAGFRRRFFVP